MIVKMENGFGGYRVFDNVEENNYTVSCNEKKTEKKESNPPLANINNKHIHSFVGGRTVSIDMGFNHYGKFVRITTDRTIYLLNDQGKTIERLN